MTITKSYREQLEAELAATRRQMAADADPENLEGARDLSKTEIMYRDRRRGALAKIRELESKLAQLDAPNPEAA